MPFQRWQECIFYWRGRAWLTIWDRVKILRYSHKLMHRKRVTCELHDSYFRSMTIKHAIPRRRKCIFRWPVMVRDWVGVELLYNSVHRKFKEFGDQRVWKWCCRENSTRQRGHSGPPIEEFGDQTSWRWDAVEKTSTQRGWAPGTRLRSPGERERNAIMARRVGVNMLQFCSVSNSLSHTTLSNKVRGIFF